MEYWLQKEQFTDQKIFEVLWKDNPYRMEIENNTIPKQCISYELEEPRADVIDLIRFEKWFLHEQEDNDLDPIKMDSNQNQKDVYQVVKINFFDNQADLLQ